MCISWIELLKQFCKVLYISFSYSTNKLNLGRLWQYYSNSISISKMFWSTVVLCFFNFCVGAKFDFIDCLRIYQNTFNYKLIQMLYSSSSGPPPSPTTTLVSDESFTWLFVYQTVCVHIYKTNLYKYPVHAMGFSKSHRARCTVMLF